MSEKQDIVIDCANSGCTEKRVFRVMDQEFYERKGFQAPKYCKTHSAERRARHTTTEQDDYQANRDQWDPGPVRRPEVEERDADLLN